MGIPVKIHKDKQLQNNIVLYHPFLAELNKRSSMLWLYLMGFQDESIAVITYKGLEGNNMDKNFYITGRKELIEKGFLVESVDSLEYTYEFYALPEYIKQIRMDDNAKAWIKDTSERLAFETFEQIDSNKKIILNETDYYIARRVLISSALDIWVYLASGHEFDKVKIANLIRLSDRSVTRGIADLKAKGYLEPDNTFIPNPIITIEEFNNVDDSGQNNIKEEVPKEEVIEDNTLYCSNNKYKGPAKIEDLLIAHNISYVKEYRLQDCCYKGTLPFDFAIFNEDHTLKCLIEYDGEQHFKYIPYWHKTEEGYNQQQMRDAIKTEYCQINNIQLIRIPYTQYDNIEKILQDNKII